MNARSPEIQSQAPEFPSAGMRSISELLGPLYELAGQSANLVVNAGARFESEGETHEIPRFIFLGNRGGDAPIRLGVFAAIHGDEVAGSYALVEFVRLLETHPELAAGYCLSLYPVCNPTGFIRGQRLTATGRDLNREFWNNSPVPEARLLQAELVTRSFQGIVILRGDRDADGFHGRVQGRVLTEQLLKPAVNAASRFVPPDSRLAAAATSADDAGGAPAFSGALSAPPRVRPKPFELTLFVPGSSPPAWNHAALIVALEQILIHYRRLICYAQNI